MQPPTPSELTDQARNRVHPTYRQLQAVRRHAHQPTCCTTPTCEVGNAAIRKFHYYRAYTLMKHVKCQCSCMWHFQRINTHAYAYVCMSVCVCVCVVCMYIELSWAASFIANVCNECKLVKSFHVARVSHVERKRSWTNLRQARIFRMSAERIWMPFELEYTGQVSVSMSVR